MGQETRKMKKIVIIVIVILVLIGAWALLNGQKGVDEPVTLGVPTSDVAGEDISDIPRYPRSVRIHYGTIPGAEDMLVVVYLTPINVDTVANFYETQLPANGWETPLGAEIIEELNLPYTYVEQGLLKGEQQAIVLVRNSEEYSGYTDINITYGPR